MTDHEVELGFTCVVVAGGKAGVIIRDISPGLVAVQVPGEPEARRVMLAGCEECSPARVLLAGLAEL